MHISIWRRVGLVSWLFVFVAVLTFPIINVMPASADANYMWTGSNQITRTSDGIVFDQINNDDLGNPDHLGYPLSLPDGVMVLEAQNDPVQCAINNNRNYTDTNWIDHGMPPGVPSIITTGNPGPYNNAYGGNGEVLVVGNQFSQNGQPYQTADTARLAIFSGDIGRCDAHQGGSVTLGNTENGGGATQWVSYNTIQNGPDGHNYIEQSINGNTMLLKGPNSNNGCSTSQMTVGGDPPNADYRLATSATWTFYDHSRGGCKAVTQTLTLTNLHINFAIVAQWTFADPPGSQNQSAQMTIENLNSHDGLGMNVGDIFASKDNINGPNMTLFNTSRNDCKGKLTLMQVNNYQTAINATISNDGTSKCIKENLPASMIDFTVTFNGFLGGNTGGGNTGGGGSVDTVCAQNSPQLGWILCPIIDLLDGATKVLQGLIGDMLEVPVGLFFTSNFQKVFYTFRDFGIALLLIAGLVMVISQATGMEIFSAYTIRKALPRIVIAMIGIALAWQLLQFVVVFFNDIGNWIGNIILSAASSGAGGGGSGTSMLGNIGLSVVGVLVGIGIIAIYGIVPTLLLLLSFGLLIIAGFFVLLIRQLIILLCIITAPLAIAAFVLPGTERIWKFWRDTLLTTLVMFPIIMAFLAAGAAVASICLTVQNNNWFVLLAILMYIVPFVALPFAFKLAGGLMSSIASIAQQGHHQSIGSRLAGLRQGESKWLHQQRMEGKRGIIGSRFGGSAYRRILTRGGLASMISPNRNSAARYRAFDQKRIGKIASEAYKNDEGFAGGDDRATRIASQSGMTRDRFIAQYGNELLNEGKASTRAEAYAQASAASGALESSFGANMGSSAMMAAAWKSRVLSGTGYAGTKEGLGEMLDDSRRMVRSGVLSESDVINTVKANQRRADQSAIGWPELQTAIRGRDNFTEVNASGTRVLRAAKASEITSLRDSALGGAQPGQIIGGRKEAVQALSERMVEETQQLAARATTPQGERTLAINLAKRAGLYDAMGQSAPANAEIMDKEVMSQQINFGGKTMTIQAAIEASRNDPRFQEMRREYASAALAAGAAGQQPPAQPVVT